jgi:transposase
MPKPISNELRERASAAYEAGGENYETIAVQFGVSRRSLQRWVERRRELGSVAPQPPGGGNFSPVDMKVLHDVVCVRPDATSYELTAQYNRCVSKKKRVHRSSIVRAIDRAGYVFKKSDYGRRSKIAPT